MLSALFKKNTSKTLPQQIYGGLMTHARSPVFFLNFKVPDTVMGRFDMLSLHVYLLARRFRADASDIAQDLSQEIFDLYVADVERALRELGIGDTSVPKKKKKMIRSFYGQIDDFDEPLNNKEIDILSEKVAARYLGEVEGAEPSLITNYILASEENLNKQDIKAIFSGTVDWIEPGSVC